MNQGFRPTRVGIIGCGAIGSIIAEAICSETIPNTTLNAVYDLKPKKAGDLTSRLKLRIEASPSFEHFIARSGVDVVVEAASQAAVRDYGEKILRSGRDLVVMSVGALLDKALYLRLQAAAEDAHRRIYIASGAIAGVDGIRAAKIAGLKEVTLTTRKNPKAFADSPFFKEKGLSAEDIKKPRLLFKGSAVEAVKYFPENVNVAATLSLAGLGPEETKVRVIADPTVTENIHEISALGGSGEMKITLRNKTHPANPKTSYLAALSAIETLRSISCAVRTGT